MRNPDPSLFKAKKEPASKTDFLNMAGISPELEEFVTDFIQKPEILDALPIERRSEIEAQMDAVLSLFAKNSGPNDRRT